MQSPGAATIRIGPGENLGSGHLAIKHEDLREES